MQFHFPITLLPSRASRPGASPRVARRSIADRLRQRRALSLVEVVFAMGILTMVCLGVLQAMMQSRRMTESSVRQASVASLVQGYLEQFKSIKFSADTQNALPSSSTASPGTTTADWEAYTGAPSYLPPVLPAKNANQESILFYLCTGTAPTAMPTISTLPTGPEKHSESVDIDNLTSNADNTQLDMWVWVNDLTGTNVVKCKQIVVVYQWTVRDGGRTRYFSDMSRCIRSVVPTD